MPVQNSRIEARPAREQPSVVTATDRPSHDGAPSENLTKNLAARASRKLADNSGSRDRISRPQGTEKRGFAAAACALDNSNGSGAG
jgi:hypothetical protein